MWSIVSGLPFAELLTERLGGALPTQQLGHSSAPTCHRPLPTQQQLQQHLPAMVGFALLYLPVHGLAISRFRELAVGLVWATPGMFVVIVPLLADTSGRALLPSQRVMKRSKAMPQARAG